MTDTDVRSFLSAFSSPVQELALKTRLLVLAQAPAAIEQIDLPARMLAYGFDRTYKGTFCVIMPLKSGLNLGFPRGVDLPDPSELLTGTGKRARHVRLSDPSDLDSPALSALLQASVELTRRSKR
jgi:hypothetical protein